MRKRYGWKARWVSGIAIAACTLTACSSEQKLFQPNETASNLREAGSFHLAVLSVVPWADFKDKLKPDFQLTGQDALKAVLPTTQSVEEKLRDQTYAGVQVGVSGALPSFSDKGATGSDKGATGSDKGATGSDKGATGNDKGATEGRNLSDLRGLDTRTIGQDPLLEFQTATALMQEVALLNSYVENAAILSSSVPYIVRLQLSALPSMRDQPLDLYANLAFLPSEEEDKLGVEKAPQVLPLLVTDNLNTTQRSRAADLVRQFALVAGGAAQGVATQAQLNKITDDLKSVVGSDLNSLFTVGRLGDSGVRVRMGAQAQSNAGYAMISRTHNLTLLVMVPRAYFVENKPVEITIVGSYDLVNGATGKKLQHENKSILLQVQKSFQQADCSTSLYISRTSFEIDRALQVALDLATDVEYGDWKEFTQTMIMNGCDKDRRDVFWRDLLNIQQELGIVSAFFEVSLPKTLRVTVLPPNQTATLLDDGDTIAKTQLYGGDGVPDSARLEVGERSLPATAIAREGNELQLTFPSLKLWGLDRASRLRLVCKRCLIVAAAPPGRCDDAADLPAPAPDDITKREEPSDGAACYRAVTIVKPPEKAGKQAATRSSPIRGGQAGKLLSQR